MSKVIKINEAKAQKPLDQMVRGTIEQTLNDLLDAEAGRLCKAKQYGHTEDGTD